MKKNFWQTIISIGLLTSCNGVGFKEKLFENYYLIAADDNSELSLYYHEPSDKNNYITLIGPTVSEIGFNSDYLIVKQNPLSSENQVEKGKTNYYILPIKNGMNWKTKNGLIGPLSNNEFRNKMRELNILDKINFTKKY